MNSHPLLLALLLIGLSSGCQQSTSNRLVGNWEGRPDTVAAAAERSVKLKAKQNSESGVDADNSDASGPLPEVGGNDSLGATLLEGYDVLIRIELKSGGDVKMELAGEEKLLTGVWRVVAELPPKG
ncbi:MAG: hypothetical protein ACR2NU_07660, partial [Aeoliella sp.]